MEGNYYYLNKNTSTREFEEHTWGTSWPIARNYACSFCKREFRSAQALGGHMNVHRRDRARLRSSLISSSSSSWGLNSDPCPNDNNIITNPNPTITTTSSSSLYLTLSSSSSPSFSHDKKPRLTPLPLLNTNPPQRSEIMMKSVGEDVKKHNVLMNNEQNISLELGIGLFKHQEESLDLELRL